MEKELAIPTADGHRIHGVLNYEGKRPDKVVVFVHGLNGDILESKYKNASTLYPKKGFATFRFALYSGLPGARKLVKSTLKTHAKDLDRVVSKMRAAGFSQIYLVGHSYGAPSILLAKNKGVNGVVFWDGTTEDRLGKAKRLPSILGYVSSQKAYLLNWGTQFLVGKKMFEVEERMPKYSSLIGKLRAPLKVMLAGDGILADSWKSILGKKTPTRDWTVIPGASHNFEQEGKEEKLLAETLSWLQGVSRVATKEIAKREEILRARAAKRRAMERAKEKAAAKRKAARRRKVSARRKAPARLRRAVRARRSMRRAGNS